VSCIYGLGTPQEYVDRLVAAASARSTTATRCCAAGRHPVHRNDLAFTRGTFRVRGDTVEIFPVYEELACGSSSSATRSSALLPAPADRRGGRRGQELLRLPGHPLRRPARADGARDRHGIEAELGRAAGRARAQGKLLEAQRLRMRTTYDIEMMRQVGFCSGIENYSRHIDGREPRAARRTACSTTSPRTSCWSSTSRTSPCRRSAACTRATCPASAPWSSTASGCRARWTTGRCAGRSSSSGSGRPSTCRRRRAVRAGQEGRGLVEQIIRPTGLVDPEVVVKPTKGQIDDLMGRSGCAPSATSGCWSPR
jgi:excinuclease ABC subunit B